MWTAPRQQISTSFFTVLIRIYSKHLYHFYLISNCDEENFICSNFVLFIIWNEMNVWRTYTLRKRTPTQCNEIYCKVIFILYSFILKTAQQLEKNMKRSISLWEAMPCLGDQQLNVTLLYRNEIKCNVDEIERQWKSMTFPFFLEKKTR